MRNNYFLAAAFICAVACNNTQSSQANISEAPKESKKTDAGPKHFRGAVSNGMKGDSIFFDLTADGKRVENLLFKGYWRCSGKLELLFGAGPEGSFEVINGKVDNHISEPPDGGSTAWRFDLKATINNNKAVGTFRTNINNLGCDSYLLKFEAFAQ